MRTSKISIGLIDHDNTLRTFQKRPQVRTGMQHTCRGIGIDDDYDLGPMRVEILRERIAWPHGDLFEGRSLESTEWLIQRIAWCWRYKHIASIEKGPKNDGQNIIGAIPCNDFIHLAAVQLCSRLPQAQRHRVRVQPQLWSDSLPQCFEHPW